MDGHDHDLDGGELWRQNEAVVVGVGHDQSAHKPRRNSPTRCPRVLKFILLVDEFDIKGLCEILPEEMRSSGLQGLAILHHSLDAIGFLCTCEPLRR